jgi:hypothetical protein
MKTGIIVCLAVAVAWAMMAILQLWFEMLSGAVFWKLTITAAIVVAVVLVVTLVIREYLAEKDMKAKGFIDE